MGRRASATCLLRARVREETLDRVELRLYNENRGKRKYGALGELVDMLLSAWLAEQEAAEKEEAEQNG